MINLNGRDTYEVKRAAHAEDGHLNVRSSKESRKRIVAAGFAEPCADNGCTGYVLTADGIAFAAGHGIVRTDTAGQVTATPVDDAPILVEISELKIVATGQGVEWWTWYRLATDRMPVSRIVDHGYPTPMGSMCTVVCDSPYFAEQLVELALERGVPKTAVRILTGAASRAEAAQRQREVDDALAAATAEQVSR